MARQAIPADLLPPFDGFGGKGFAFLRDLRDNQDRTWFQAHRDVYEAELHAPMAALVAALSTRLGSLGLPLRGDPARAIFRINRDVRFSKDKSPYKTHVGAALTRDGGKLSPGVLYIHIEPAGCFAAAGFHQPDAPALEAIRQVIATDPATWRDAVTRLRDAALDLGPDETALRRLPRGFEQVTEPDLAEAVRRRNFVVRRPLTQAAAGRADLVATLADFALAAAPLLRLGWEAIDG